MRSILRRLGWLFNRRRRDDELRDEIQFHLEEEAAQQEAQRLPPQEAKWAARRDLGNVSVIFSDTRASWGWNRFEQLMLEFRHALRRLGNSPGFTATALLTIALGIGAATAVYTLVDSILLRPLTFHDSGRLVAVWERIHFLSPDPMGPNPRHADFWSKQSSSFTGLALLQHSSIGLTLGAEHPSLVGVLVATPNLFDVLEVAPLYGRTFLAEDAVQGRDRVAILTYKLWLTAFQGDPEIVGKTVRLGDVNRQVIGVLPETFHFPNRNALRSVPSKQPLSNVPEPAIFVPASVDLSAFNWNGEYGNWICLGRLKSGVTIDSAQAELNSLEVQIVRQMPAQERDSGPEPLQAALQPMREAMVGSATVGLWFLMAAVAGLLLIASLNLANAQLARTFIRYRETSVCSALGAPTWRLVWGSLIENAILATVGGASGILLAVIALDRFRRFSPVDLPRLSEVQLNGTVLLVAIALTIGSAMLFSVLPVLNLIRGNRNGYLQQSNNRTIGSQLSRRLHTSLIAAQVFGCTVLLVLTALFSRNLLQLMHQEKGFDSEQVAFAQVNLSGQTYGPAQTRVAFIDAVLENLRAISGVRAAGFVSAMPLEGESWIESLRRVDQPQIETPLINLRWASPGYFEAMHHRLISGRLLEERDRNLSNVILSEGEAKSLWPSSDPVGQKIQTQGRTFTVIGVVADSRSTSLKSAPVRLAYLHYKDRTASTNFFMVRGSESPDTLLVAMRQAIWRHAPAVTIARVKTLDAHVSESLAPERFQTSILIGFGLAALFLAMLGIHGVLRYSVTTRKQEIGVRMALGASRGEIYRLIFGQVGTPVFAGLAAGLLATILAGRVVKKLLYGAQSIDLPVALAVSTLFLAAAFAAGFFPARQAASVDPMTSLRAE